ncbi:hypothetical protein TWF696_004209 [Orbilia brochopaga]|uniref:Uncharacterized protein n=1 Tax=Orbilia brochopaga TaxID=3140254 RepID=A0AAV9V895_9PEZI
MVSGTGAISADYDILLAELLIPLYGDDDDVGPEKENSLTGSVAPEAAAQVFPTSEEQAVPGIEGLEPLETSGLDFPDSLSPSLEPTVVLAEPLLDHLSHGPPSGILVLVTKRNDIRRVWPAQLRNGQPGGDACTTIPIRLDMSARPSRRESGLYAWPYPDPRSGYRSERIGKPYTAFKQICVIGSNTFCTPMEHKLNKCTVSPSN